MKTIIKEYNKAIYVLIINLTFALAVNATVRNDYVEVDDVLYRTAYGATPYVKNYTCRECNVDFYYNEVQYYLDHESHRRIEGMAYNFEAQLLNFWPDFGFDAVYRFHDGSELPAMEYGALVSGPRVSLYSGLPMYDEGKDPRAHNYPFYTGYVWLQDSVYMQNLPNLQEKKYHVVYGICVHKDENGKYVSCFNEKLRFIRTPRFTMLCAGTFKDCTGLHTARIGAAQSVQSLAFENCTSLETVFFESAPYVYEDAFKNCPNIKYVVMDGKCPSPLNQGYGHAQTKEDRSPFDEQVYEQAVLYVHEDQIEAFRNDLTWGKFKYIRDIEEYNTGVDAANPDLPDVKYQVYNLSGVLVCETTSGENWREGLPAGIYIVKSSLGSSKKVCIK